MRVWMPVLLFALAACDGGGAAFPATFDTGPRPTNTCTPGRVAQCFCTGARTGIQVCNTSEVFDPCVCSDFPDTGPAYPDAAPIGVDGGFTEAGVAVDGGFVDTGAVALDTGAGHPDATVVADSGVVVDEDAASPAPDAMTFPDADLPPPIDAGHAGTSDAGFIDTGAPVVVDAGSVDTGVAVDTGVVMDATAVADSGVVVPADAGFADAGTASCNSDTQCPSGRCHPVFHQCVPPRQSVECATCTDDSQCGLPGDECLRINVNNQTLEQVCGQRCNSNGDCRRGFSCQFNNQCYPIPGSLRPHTCASLRDMLASETCDPASIMDTCGINGYADGTCLTIFNQCVVGCNTDNDCPMGSRCVSLVLASYCMP